MQALANLLQPKQIIYDEKIQSIIAYQKAFAIDISKHPSHVDLIDLKIIYTINFCEQALLIGSKNGLIVYSLCTHKPIYSQNQCVWQAVFIPNTNCIAYTKGPKTNVKQDQVIIKDFYQNKIIAKFRVNFQVQQLKASQYCLVLTTSSRVYIVHLPTLKPIFDGPGGNGLKLLCDVSSDGLTMSHDCSSIGQIVVHNFTNIQVSNFAIALLMKNSIIGEKNQKKGSQLVSSKEGTHKNEINIQAHKDTVSVLKLSPNGLRVATASNKGTIIRIFCCMRGIELQQLRVGFQLCKVVDIDFIQQGTSIACVSKKNLIKMFNVCMSQYDHTYQKTKKNHQTYEQGNPKSIFSFLKIFNKNLDNDYPFAQCKLIKPILHQNKDDQLQKTNEKYLQVTKQIQTLQQQQGQVPILEVLAEKQIQQNSVHKSRKNDSKKKKNQEEKNSNYNTISRIHMGTNNTIRVLKGNYLYIVKYDPFNGGQMYQLQTISLI